MTNILYVPYTNKKIKIKNLDKNGISRAVKVHLTRNKLDLFNLLEGLDIDLLKCSFCDEYNPRFVLICNIENDIISITAIEYTYLNAPSDIRYCYTNKKCRGKRLNPNSIEFVKNVYSLNDLDALKLIHSRNTTPFYRHNHETNGQYKKSQSRNAEWCHNNNISQTDVIKKANYSRSLGGYKEKYGDHEGEQRWKAVQQTKAITVTSLMKKHGKIVGEEMYDEWLRTTRNTLDIFIIRYGKITGSLKYFEYIAKKTNVDIIIKNYPDFVKYCTEYIKKYETYGLTNFPLKNRLLLSALIVNGIGVFNKTIDDVIVDMKRINSNIQSVKYFKNTGRYGVLSYTDEGHLLRSGLEVFFYITMKEANLTTVEYDVGKQYPQSNWCYDFLFLKHNIYIEIAGLYGTSDEYDNKIKQKEKIYNSWILYNKSDIIYAIKKLKKMYEV